MKSLLSLLILVLMVSCQSQDKSDLVVFETTKEDFNKYINFKVLPAEPNLSIDKTIVNNDYPIELALYNDGKFYYNLPTLADGDGSGTWVFKNGKLRLYAQRRLFDMHIMIKALEEGAGTVGIEFSDRFGPQFLKMENQNL